MYETKWRGHKGSVIYADGMLYCYDETDGFVGLVKATPEKFEVISEQIYSLSPYDGIKLPTAMFFPHMEGEIDLSSAEFMELLSLKTSYIRNSILTERLKQQRKNGS